MTDFLTALGLLLVIEGVVYAAFPSLVKRMASEALSAPDKSLRIGGLVAAFAGLGIVWFLRS
ncbi:DUF2065 domain-containing protein [Fulvimarina sp. 2208YS6-2-32]|uniref:DUF2065 domain-containing protein n=1 Tax=Fulvimarina uroteuthidis TaxID=3098149 RepID=A0ABU5HZQ4_9HYPH|nr:DUF2065 domain-containing protein [Fulvimarina sp. 2208YS6-2-32]MDY8108613.1 DUF2065 domain-containing protein [Fulvimarina sp. 2208YS6-2-32]